MYMAKLTKNNMEYVAHIHVDGTDHCIYMSVCHTSATLHIFKYDQFGCEYELFPHQDFGYAAAWIKEPVKHS